MTVSVLSRHVLIPVLEDHDGRFVYLDRVLFALHTPQPTKMNKGNRWLATVRGRIVNNSSIACSANLQPQKVPFANDNRVFATYQFG